MTKVALYTMGHIESPMNTTTTGQLQFKLDLWVEEANTQERRKQLGTYSEFILRT
jgi:hypothetical protein